MNLEEYSFNSTQAWCDFLVNALGCNELALQYSYLNSKGIQIFTKKIGYFELMAFEPNEKIGLWNLTRERFFEQANNFSGCDILLTLDFDDANPIKYFWLIETLNYLDLNIWAFATPENRCQHISLFIPQLRSLSKTERNSVRSKIIKIVGCDPQMASEDAWRQITYPTSPGNEVKHRKTGQPIFCLHEPTSFFSYFPTDWFNPSKRPMFKSSNVAISKEKLGNHPVIIYLQNNIVRDNSGRHRIWCKNLGGLFFDYGLNLAEVKAWANLLEPAFPGKKNVVSDITGWYRWFKQRQGVSS